MYKYTDADRLTISEVAELLEVNTKTLRRWDKSGKLVANRTIGGHRRYSLEAIKPLLEQKRKKKWRYEIEQKLDDK